MRFGFGKVKIRRKLAVIEPDEVRCGVQIVNASGTVLLLFGLLKTVSSLVPRVYPIHPVVVLS